eukprot:symbB.v1.2.038491.t1/scaffold6015.1/size21752/1
MDNGETKTYDSTTAAECMKAKFQWQKQNFKGSELQRDPSPKKQLEQRDDSWVLRAPTLSLGKQEHAAATGQEGTTEASKELEKAALQAEATAMEDARNGLVASGTGEESKEPPHVPLDKNNMVNGRVLPKGWCNIPFLTPAEQQPKAQAKRKARGKAKSKPSKVEQEKEDVEVPAPPKGQRAKAKASKPMEDKPQQHVEVPAPPKGRKRKADPSNVEEAKEDVEVPEAPKGRKRKADPEQAKQKEDVEVPEAPKGRKRKADPEQGKRKMLKFLRHLRAESAKQTRSKAKGRC